MNFPLLYHNLSKKRGGLLILLILLVAAGLRLYGLPVPPPGPHYDEAANGILAAEVGRNGRWPLFLPAYTGKEVLFFYWAALWMRLLGVNLLALRLAAALAGLLTVATTAWMVRELFAPDRQPSDPADPPATGLALLTAALLATSFWHLLLSRVGFRAILQPLLQALTLAALGRGMRLSPQRGRWLTLAGLLCGLTAYTYLAARAFPIPLLVFWVALLLEDRDRRRTWLAGFLRFGLAALVAFAPLGLYFLRHPAAFTTRMAQVGPGADWEAVPSAFLRSLAIFFWRGDPYIRFNLPGRPLFGPVVGFLFVLGLLATLGSLRRKRSPQVRARELLLLTWLPAMLLPTALAVHEVLPSNLRAVGLIPLVFLFPARGALLLARWLSPWADRLLPASQRIGQAARVEGLVLLLLLGPGGITARDYFFRYASRTDLFEQSDGDLAAIAAYLNQADLEATTVYVASIHYRHPTLAFLSPVYPQVRWLVGGQTLVYPAQGDALYLFPRSARPDPAWLDRYLPASARLETPPGPDGAPAFLAYRLSPAAMPTLTPQRPQDADFGHVLRLLGYDLEEATSGDRVTVTLYWQVQNRPPLGDYGTYLRLEDSWGHVWGESGPFHYPAELWTPGERIVDRLTVPVAPGAPPGDYRLRVSLYAPSAGATLSLVDAQGGYAGQAVRLGPIPLARAPTPPDPARLPIRHRLEQAMGPGLTLLGYDPPPDRRRPGERLPVTLYWQAGGAPTEDYTVRLRLISPVGEEATLYEDAPVHGTYPTGRWTPGEVVVDRYDPRLPRTLPPGTFSLRLELLSPAGSLIGEALPLGKVTVEPIARQFERPAIGHPLEVTLGHQVALLGYDLDLGEFRPGGLLRLTLYWQPLTTMETDYTVFVHLLGPEGQMVAQEDRPPGGGTYPTTLWLPPEIVVDAYAIPLPTSLPKGAYRLEVGLYQVETGERLPVFDGAGRLLGDQVLLDLAPPAGCDQNRLEVVGAQRRCASTPRNRLEVVGAQCCCTSVGAQRRCASTSG